MRHRRTTLLWVVIFLGAAVIGSADEPAHPNDAATGGPLEATTAGPVANDEELYGPFQPMSRKQLWQARVELLATNRPPWKGEVAKRLWQWRRAMDNADDAFEHKAPIEFYGKVVDQYGNAVTGATVRLQWSIIGGAQERLLETGTDGEFSLIGEKGKGLSVRVSKRGYVLGKEGRGGFEYGDLFAWDFHIPNPTNPVMFRLRRLQNPELIYVRDPTGTLDVKGTPVWVDVGTGKTGSVGDVAFSVVRHEYPGSRTSGYTLTIEAAEGGALVVTNEEFMFLAPESGYVPKLVIAEKAGKPGDWKFKVTQEVRFYLKTADNKYAAIVAKIAQFQSPGAGLQSMIYFNPSGSRNLEVAPDKTVEPRSHKRPERGEPVKSRMEKASQTGAK